MGRVIGGKAPALVVALLMAGCDGNGNGTFGTTDRLRVTSVAPPEGAVNVVVTTDVRATFNREMDATSLTTSSFLLEDLSRNAVPGSVSFDAVNDTVTFVPADDLLPDAEYRATLTGDVQDATGAALTPDAVWTFTTAPIMLRVSVDAFGLAGNGDSLAPALSDDGRFVVFESAASNLVGAGTGVRDIFRKDVQSGEIVRVNTSGGGAQANGDSFAPAVSGDGRFVAFGSAASNLVDDDTNTVEDIFVKDLDTGAITRASTDSSGVQADRASARPALSADGRFVVFESGASNLVPGGGSTVTDIFHKDIQTGAIVRVSTDGDGVQANGGSGNAVVSANGRLVAFVSVASNLVAGDTNGVADVFVKEVPTGVITRASASADGIGADTASGAPAISGDGRFIAFVSNASNLVGGSHVVDDVFVKDRETGAIARATTAAGGTAEEGVNLAPALSGDGRFVTFVSGAGNQVADDTNTVADVFVKDLESGAVLRLARSAAGVETNGASSQPAISADGRYVAFESEASNLDEGDDNTVPDIFRGQNTLLSP